MRLELPGHHPLLRRNLVMRGAEPGRLVLDARRLMFASPLDLTAAAAAMHTHAAAGRETTLVLPDSPDVTAYMQRMDLLKALPHGTRVEGDVPDETRYDRSTTLLEIAHLQADTADVIGERLGQMAIRHLGPRDGRRVFKGVGELIDNAISHGASTCGAFTAAQAYSGKTTGYRRLEIAVCDTGIGVLSHLRRNPDHAHIVTSAEALKHALRPGVSGTQDKRGNGLPDLLSGPGGSATTRLVLRSGDGLLRASRLRGSELILPADTSVPVQGTWSWLRVSYRS
ncbi:MULTISPECIES: hypothetical protein [unclassified Streptomyces]|uniref:hypothetical protein n=1 Tax=unclassified Streptomyces TaxID=2593676 RepID=UPI002E2CA8C8|nr:hypothetical protein [Streptomyces sp. NBC_00343]WSX07829.1 hypothetical protein OG496_00950 [Streptomyces sp. NBC_00988]